MIYRCRTCDHEEARGFLPSASCFIYFVFLLALSVGSLILAVRGVRLAVGKPAAPAEDETHSWWDWVVGIPLGLLLILVGMLAIKFALEAVEWVAFCRRRCPACGSRKWSRGFTRGFGL